MKNFNNFKSEKNINNIFKTSFYKDNNIFVLNKDVFLKLKNNLNFSYSHNKNLSILIKQRKKQIVNYLGKSGINEDLLNQQILKNNYKKKFKLFFENYTKKDNENNEKKELNLNHLKKIFSNKKSRNNNNNNNNINNNNKNENLNIFNRTFMSNYKIFHKNYNNNFINNSAISLINNSTINNDKSTMINESSLVNNKNNNNTIIKNESSKKINNNFSTNFKTYENNSKIVKPLIKNYKNNNKTKLILLNSENNINDSSINNNNNYNNNIKIKKPENISTKKNNKNNINIFKKKNSIKKNITISYHKLKENNDDTNKNLKNIFNKTFFVPYLTQSFQNDLSDIINKKLALTSPGKFSIIKDNLFESEMEKTLKNYWKYKKKKNQNKFMNKKFKELIHNMNVKVRKDIIRCEKKNINLKFGTKNMKFYDKYIQNEYKNMERYIEKKECNLSD